MVNEIGDVLIVGYWITPVKTLVDMRRFLINLTIKVKNGDCILLILIIIFLPEFFNNFRFILLKNYALRRATCVHRRHMAFIQSGFAGV